MLGLLWLVVMVLMVVMLLVWMLVLVLLNAKWRGWRVSSRAVTIHRGWARCSPNSVMSSIIVGVPRRLPGPRRVGLEGIRLLRRGIVGSLRVGFEWFAESLRLLGRPFRGWSIAARRQGAYRPSRRSEVLWQELDEVGGKLSYDPAITI